MPHAKPEHYQQLMRVVTLAEAARICFRGENSIRYAIDAGHIAAIKCGRIWLISVDSLVEHFPVPAQKVA